jgi:NadR type nicotinamide-nucleotide adenylyltransferase
MKIGLVVGKFAPFHDGHYYLLETASKHCDRLIVLTYTSEYQYKYPGYMRESWIKHHFPKAEVYVLDKDCPADETDELIHREYCATFLRDVLNTSVHIVFSSESYGQPFAAYLAEFFRCNTTHYLVDIDRRVVPICATDIRNGKEGFLSDFVANSLKPSIAILGPESSGKTTLVTALAGLLGEPIIPEYGRLFGYQTNNTYRLEDMLFIAKQQIQLEDNAKITNYKICDTTPLTTAWYSKEFFDYVDPKLQQLTKRRYTFTFIADNLPFIQDGTRNIAYRQRQSDFYKGKGVLLPKDHRERLNVILETLSRYESRRKKLA